MKGINIDNPIITGVALFLFFGIQIAIPFLTSGEYKKFINKKDWCLEEYTKEKINIDKYQEELNRVKRELVSQVVSKDVLSEASKDTVEYIRYLNLQLLDSKNNLYRLQRECEEYPEIFNH